MKIKASILILTASFFLIIQGDPVCFYTETNYQGDKLCNELGNINVWQDYGQFNDAFRSVTVPPHTIVIMFSDDTFHGYSTIADKDIPDLAAIDMDSKISSYIIKPNEVCFYTETNFNGVPHCYESRVDLYREDPDMNDQFQSVKIPFGLQVVVFNDDDYHGYATLLRGDIADLSAKGVWRSISSLIISPDGEAALMK